MDVNLNGSLGHSKYGKGYTYQPIFKCSLTSLSRTKSISAQPLVHKAFSLSGPENLDQELSHTSSSLQSKNFPLSDIKRAVGQYKNL